MVTNDRMSRLQEQVTSVLQEFGEDDAFAIIDYDSSASVVSDWGPATESRKADALAAVGNMVADGATNYHAGLQKALDLGAGGDATQVIFLSDGLPFDPEAPDPENTDGILDLVDQIIASGIERLDTIALGIDSQILEDMAAQGSGEMVIVPD
jgi:hypothetical protein